MWIKITEEPETWPEIGSNVRIVRRFVPMMGPYITKEWVMNVHVTAHEPNRLIWFVGPTGEMIAAEQLDFEAPWPTPTDPPWQEAPGVVQWWWKVES